MVSDFYRKILILLKSIFGNAHFKKKVIFCIMALAVIHLLLTVTVYQFNNKYSLCFTEIGVLRETFNFYPLIIRDDPTQTPFAWSYHKSGIRFRSVPSRASYKLKLLLRARNDSPEGRYIRLEVGGSSLFEGEVTLQWTWYKFDLPAELVKSNDLWVIIHTKPKVLERARGKIIRGIRVAAAELARDPDGGLTFPPSGYWIFSSLLILFSVLIMLVGGVRNRVLFWTTAGVEVLFAIVLLTPFKGAFVRSIDWILYPFVLAVIVGLISRAAIKMMNRRNEFSIGKKDIDGVALLVGVSLALKAGLWFIVSLPSIDLVFHTHRMHDVFDGEYLLMSHGGGYRFPYPPTFYFLLYPLRLLFEQDHLLIRIGFSILIGFTPLLVYLIVLKLLKDKKAALYSALIFVVMPMDFYIYTLGIIANGFGHFMMLLSIVMGVYLYRRTESFPASFSLILVFSLTMLSHFGQMISFSFLFLFTVLMLFLSEKIGKINLSPSRKGDWQSQGLNPKLYTGVSLRMLALFIISAGVAFIAFYYHLLGPTLRNIGKLIVAQGSEESARGVFWFSTLNILKSGQNIIAKFGLLPFIAALCGFMMLVRKKKWSHESMFLSAWLVAFAVQWWLSMKTILMLRFELFVYPLIAILAGYFFSRMKNNRWMLCITVAVSLSISLYLWARFNADISTIGSVIIPHRKLEWLFW